MVVLGRDDADHRHIRTLSLGTASYKYRIPRKISRFPGDMITASATPQPAL